MSRQVRLPAGAPALAAATAGQGGVLVLLDRPTPVAALQVLLVTLALAAVVHEVWRNRLRIDHRVDMLLTMLAFGGLGMALGTVIDRAITTEPAVAMAMHHGHHGHQPSADAGWPRLLIEQSLTWMTGMMLIGGILPSLFMTRCAVLARRSRRRLLSTHVVGNIGMVVGMIAGGHVLGGTLGGALGLMETGHHVAMLAGMLAGMTVAQFAAEVVLGLRPWRVIRGPVAPVSAAAGGRVDA